jgi:glutathione S-transferase
MPDEIVFYTNPMSRGRTVRWMLEEIGTAYRTEVLEFGTTMKAPEYLAINPMGKVPAIRHGKAVVTESAAICAYLADGFRKPGWCRRRTTERTTIGGCSSRQVLWRRPRSIVPSGWILRRKRDEAGMAAETPSGRARGSRHEKHLSCRRALFGGRRLRWIPYRNGPAFRIDRASARFRRLLAAGKQSWCLPPCL